MDRPSELAKDNITYVPTTFSNVPWVPGFQLGAGYDILTGNIKASPFSGRPKAGAGFRPEMYALYRTPLFSI